MYLLELFSVEIVNIFIQLSHGFPKLGIEMILDTVVRPTIYSVGQDGPFVAYLIMKSKKFFLFILGPSCFDEDGINAQSWPKLFNMVPGFEMLLSLIGWIIVRVLFKPNAIEINLSCARLVGSLIL